MKRSTALLGAAALVVGAWILLFERGDPPDDDREPVFGVAARDVASVEIGMSDGASARLEQRADGFVVVGEDGEHPADASEADLLVQNVGSLRASRSLGERAAAELAGFGLAPPRLTVRVVSSAGDGATGPPVEIGFGDEAPTPGNRYLLRASGEVLLVDETAMDRFARTAWELRDRRLFRNLELDMGADVGATASLRLRAGGREAALVQDGGRWRIAAPIRFAADAFAAARLVSLLTDVEMLAEWDPSDEAASPAVSRLDAPRLVATLGLRGSDDGGKGGDDAPETRTIRFGAASESPAGVFARLDGGASVFVLPDAVFGEMLAAAEDGFAGLRSLGLLDFSVFRVVRLEMSRPDGESVSFRRDGSGADVSWTVAVSGGAPAPADGEAVEDLLHRLNSMEAGSVAGETTGEMTTPAWSFRITERIGEPDHPDTPDAESRTESVSIRESGDLFLALREGNDLALRVSPERWREIEELVEAAWPEAY